VAHGLE
jgi:ribosomal protein S18 acetylase RimI-like enzyme